MALDEAARLSLTGRYVSDMSIIDISPSGDGGLTVKLSYPRQPSKRTRRRMSQFLRRAFITHP